VGGTDRCSRKPALRLLLALSAFICVHLRLKILACGLPRTRALAASHAVKKFLPQMNADGSGADTAGRCVLTHGLGGVGRVSSAPAPCGPCYRGMECDYLRKDPMQRGAPGRQNWIGWLSRWPRKCGFRARTLWARLWVGSADRVGGRIGRHGRRLRPGAECVFPTKTLWIGLRPGLSGRGPVPFRC